MANHPYNQHREQQVAHRRVNTILSGSPSGATKHASGHAFSKLTSKSAASRDDEVVGSSAPKRFARGGKVKSKGKGDTNIAIVLPGGDKGGDVPGMPKAGMPPPMPPMPPKPPMPMPPPPGLGGGMPGGPPPGGPPPGMMPPMRAKGGRVGKFTGGALSGVGREEKADKKRK